MMQRFYSVDEQTGSTPSADRKKLKRQSTTEMDMTDISANSLLCGMQQFDRAVQNMEETILVPSRLMDMSVSDESSPKQKPVPSLLKSSDAYDVFQLLKSVRCTVRRGGCSAESDELESKPLRPMPSMRSSQSLSSLSSEASSSGAAGDDSGHESEPSEHAAGEEQPCEAVRARFESHLSGLGQCLAQMTEAASFLSSRYEQQLDSAF